MKKRIAKDLLDIQAVFLKPQDPFTWASGIKSPIYTDNRVTLAYPETRTLIEDGFVEKIRAEFPDVEVIAGTATGIAHAAIVATILGLPMGYVRASSKDHGRQNQIEGKLIDNAKIVVIEDLISTGGSVLDAVAAAKREGADVLGVVAIFTYQLEKADKKFNARFNAKSRTYLYIMRDEDNITPFEANYVTGLRRSVDVERFQEIMNDFVGKYDFSSFMKKDKA